jgi:hypothetical protein
MLQACVIPVRMAYLWLVSSAFLPTHQCLDASTEQCYGATFSCWEIGAFNCNYAVLLPTAVCVCVCFARLRSFTIHWLIGYVACLPHRACLQQLPYGQTPEVSRAGQTEMPFCVCAHLVIRSDGLVCGIWGAWRVMLCRVWDFAQ